MKCKIFVDVPFGAQESFNKWAKGKALTKEVIIHTHQYQSGDPEKVTILMIVVFHPEDPHWDKTEPTLTAPIHDKPEPHIKEKEIVITA